jgi:ubiquitin C-terminal hydrolase
MEGNSPKSRMASFQKGVVGLTNIGNTCYGNSVIQAIRHQVDFTLFMLQDNHLPLLKKKMSTEKTRLLEAYGSLVHNLWSSESTVSTKDLWGKMIPAAINAGVEQLRIPIPHDAHEFLVFLLDQFHEALAEEVNMVIRSTSSDINIKGALEFWKSSFQKSYSPLVELVFGIQRKCVTCSQCKNESISWETMNMLKVCVAKDRDTNITELLKSEEDEIIDEYHCEKCPTRSKASVNRSLWRLGNWVIIVLKRNENSGRRINSKVDIPLLTSFKDGFHKASQEPSSLDSYELFSTIHHHGSAGGGHYTSHAKHPVTGKWAHYDDESATIVDNPRLDSSTYIVMYRRISQ